MENAVDSQGQDSPLEMEEKNHPNHDFDSVLVNVVCQEVVKMFKGKELVQDH